MAWRTAYGPTTLGESNGLGGTYTYVVRIPAAAFSDTDVFTRLKLRGPPTGQSRVQALWIGHPAGSGDAYDFDGAQVQGRVGNAVTFTLAAGQSVNTDAIAFARDPAKDVLVAYELLSGDRYANATGLSGFTLFYKLVAGQAGLTDKSGYTTLTGWTALVTGAEVTDEEEVTEPPPPPPPPSEPSSDAIASVLAGERFASGATVAGQTGSMLHFQLANPAGSGRTGLLYHVILTPETDVIVSLRQHNALLGNAMEQPCNVMFNSGIEATLASRYGQQASPLGGEHARYKLQGGVPYFMTSYAPLIGLPPGTGVVLALHSTGVGATINFEWREIAT
jgi:hypothetical protein